MLGLARISRLSVHSKQLENKRVDNNSMNNGGMNNISTYTTS